MKNKVWMLIVALLFPIMTSAHPIKLNDIKIQGDKDKAHLQFLLSKPTQWHVFSLENPKRIIVDFENARAFFHVKNRALDKTIIKSIRKGYPKPGILRIVIDVNSNVQYKTFSHQKVSILKLDLISEKKFLKKEAKLKDIIVVIDPGHGGKDPGAIGRHGTKEKDVVLSIARMLADRINAQPNMRAILTRNGDYFVSLAKRLQITRHYKADLFIAIHADSYFNNNAAGASVYSLSHHGATSVAARWLAQRENHSELDDVDLNDLEDQSVLLRSVLLDLAQTATQKASVYCGRGLLDALSDVTKLHYSKVEQAPFMVLKSPDIPSVLVETGFISNVNEERRLRNKNHQYKMAKALFEGVSSFQRKFLVKEG